MSSDLNNICLSGRIVRDAEVRQTPAGKAICNVSIAVGGYRKDDAATFFDLVLFDGKTGVAPFLKKGTRVVVNGRLRRREFQRKDGTAGVSIEVAVNDLTLLGGKQDNGNNGGDGPLIERRGARPGNDWDSNDWGKSGGSGGSDDIPF